MRDVIASAIFQGIAQGLKERADRSGQGHKSKSKTPRPSLHLPSVVSAESVSEGEDLAEPDLSENEGLVPDKPAFMGLFKPSLFKSILYKAKVITHLEASPTTTQESTDPADPSGGVI